MVLSSGFRVGLPTRAVVFKLRAYRVGLPNRARCSGRFRCLEESVLM